MWIVLLFYETKLLYYMFICFTLRITWVEIRHELLYSITLCEASEQVNDIWLYFCREDWYFCQIAAQKAAVSIHLPILEYNSAFIICDYLIILIICDPGAFLRDVTHGRRTPQWNICARFENGGRLLIFSSWEVSLYDWVNPTIPVDSQHVKDNSDQIW